MERRNRINHYKNGRYRQTFCDFFGKCSVADQKFRVEARITLGVVGSVSPYISKWKDHNKNLTPNSYKQKQKIQELSLLFIYEYIHTTYTMNIRVCWYGQRTATHGDNNDTHFLIVYRAHKDYDDDDTKHATTTTTTTNKCV